MNTNRLLIGLVIALVVAFLLSSFVYKQFQKASIVKPTDTQPLVVAAVPLPLGTRLDASNLKVIQWPANQQVAGMFTRVEDCVNRAVITTLTANEPVLESKLAPKESGAGLAATDGRIQLALRNTIDTKKNEPKAIVQAALFSPQGAIATPAPPRVSTARK